MCYHRFVKPKLPHSHAVLLSQLPSWAMDSNYVLIFGGRGPVQCSRSGRHLGAAGQHRLRS